MRLFYGTILFFLTTSYFAQVVSCSLDPVFIGSNKKGIWPDSATNFVSGTVNGSYMQNITVKVPKDTVSGFGTFCFNRVELTTPAGYTNFNLPPGLTLLAGNNVTLTGSTYKFPGNANNCVVITGTPTTAGTYTVQFKVQPYVSFSPCSTSPDFTQGAALTAPSILTYYKIAITPSVGLNENIFETSLNLTNVPNPFCNKTTLKFSIKDEASINLYVSNLLGDRIFEDKFKTILGENTYELNCSDWSNGVYLYTIQYKNHTVTKRMILNSAR